MNYNGTEYVIGHIIGYVFCFGLIPAVILIVLFVKFLRWWRRGGRR